MATDSNKFGIGITKADKKVETDNVVEEDKISHPVEGTIQPTKADDAFDAPYLDERSITISLVKNYSLFRKANDKSMPKRKDYIGSSVKSSRELTSNSDEINAYFPSIVGVSSNDPSFLQRVKQYLNNIRVGVDELGRTFNTSFQYNRKRDWYNIHKQEEEIENEYNSINRNNIKLLKDGLVRKIKKLNDLERTKYQYGYPTNIEDYIMYRHCLLYNDVAKDIALINSDANIRFYFKDDKKEYDKAKKYRIEINKAKANYVACLADNELFDAIYMQYCTVAGLPVISSLGKDRLDKEIELDKFSETEPIKFNRIYNNKDVKLISKIELLIARGELIRSPYNQNITSTDGEFIGSNITEAVSYFKNPNNNSVVTAYYNKLKNI